MGVSAESRAKSVPVVLSPAAPRTPPLIVRRCCGRAVGLCRAHLHHSYGRRHRLALIRPVATPSIASLPPRCPPRVGVLWHGWRDVAIAIPALPTGSIDAVYDIYAWRSLRASASRGFVQEGPRIRAGSFGATPTDPRRAPEKVVVREKSLMAELASTTPGLVLQAFYAGVLAFLLLAHRNNSRRQIMRIPASFNTRVRLARVMRDINERVGHYLFSLAVIYTGVAACSTIALAVLGFPNAIIWGALMGIAGFVPFIGSAVTIAVVALVALITFDDWPRIVGAPAALLAIHVIEANFVTPMFVSRRCALNTVAVFAAIARSLEWGAMGAIVAVPLRS